MKSKAALFLSAVCALTSPLAAGCKPSEPPKNDDTKKQVSMNGERHDNNLDNRTNRAQENGNTQREQNMEDREDNAETRQDNREDRR